MIPWINTPSNINLVDRQHDRSVMCLDVANDIVTGSADHGLRVFGRNGVFKRELFGKEAGHTEWVTTCSWCPDGKIVSGGMDGRICLWPQTGGKKCDFLMGHSTSVSKLAVDDSNFCVSVGYDGLTLLWNLNTVSKSPVSAYGGVTKQPVMNFGWLGSLLVTSNRGGDLCFFDVNTEQRISAVRCAHQGDICRIAFCSDPSNSSGHQNRNILITAGRLDARLCLWDLRSSANKPMAQSQCHKQALNGCGFHPCNGRIYTASAEGAVKIFDVRADINLRKGIDIGVGGPILTTWTDETHESAILVGTQGGSVVGMDWEGFEKWRHEQKAPVTCLGAGNGVLSAGMEDGQVLVMNA